MARHYNRLTDLAGGGVSSLSKRKTTTVDLVVVDPNESVWAYTAGADEGRDTPAFMRQLAPASRATATRPPHWPDSPPKPKITAPKKSPPSSDPRRPKRQDSGDSSPWESADDAAVEDPCTVKDLRTDLAYARADKAEAPTAACRRIDLGASPCSAPAYEY